MVMKLAGQSSGRDVIIAGLATVVKATRTPNLFLVSSEAWRTPGGGAKDPVKTNNDAFIEAKAAIQSGSAARLRLLTVACFGSAQAHHPSAVT
ncbi:MAG: hypothetical protein OSB05_11700, partial [Akkermansiaceae bacterium]|nr:hypothetical protein [Akkermansiaceae bacterium]